MTIFTKIPAPAQNDAGQTLVTLFYKLKSHWRHTLPVEFAGESATKQSAQRRTILHQHTPILNYRHINRLMEHTFIP